MFKGYRLFNTLEQPAKSTLKSMEMALTFVGHAAPEKNIMGHWWKEAQRLEQHVEWLIFQLQCLQMNVLVTPTSLFSLQNVYEPAREKDQISTLFGGYLEQFLQRFVVPLPTGNLHELEVRIRCFIILQP